MQILTFIVIEGRPDYQGRNGKDDVYAYTMQGECYLPLETPIPVIKKGQGCIGVGMVTKITVTKTSTDIYYTLSDISDASAKAYYDLYRNQATASNSDEYREDVVIPGMMRANIGPASTSDYDTPKRKKNKSIYDDIW